METNLSKAPRFYCKVYSGDSNFSIEKWNEDFTGMVAAGVSESLMNKVLHPEPCDEQCFECMAIVGERRKKTEEIINRKFNG